MEESFSIVNYDLRPLVFSREIISNLMRGFVSEDLYRCIEAGAYNTACRMMSITNSSSNEIAKSYVTRERYQTRLSENQAFGNHVRDLL